MNRTEKLYRRALEAVEHAHRVHGTGSTEWDVAVDIMRDRRDEMRKERGSPVVVR